MTDDLTIVTFGGDSSGTGFSLYRVPGRPEPADRFVAAARALTRDGVRQPVDDMAVDTTLSPVWGFRHVVVEDAGFWCFTVQGINRRFGRAGSCQFLFMPDARPAHQVWDIGVRLVDGDGRLGFDIARDRLPHAESAWVRPVLEGLWAADDPVVIDGDPHRVAMVITDVLSVLPSAVVKGRVWWTYPLHRPRLERCGVVSGRPPDAGDGPVSQWLRGGPDRTASSGVEVEAEALDWLAEAASKGWSLSPDWWPAGYLALPDMASLVEAVVSEWLPLDVPRLIEAGDDRLERHRVEVIDWIMADPDEAVRRLMGCSVPWLDAWLFELLLSQQRNSGLNVLRCPPMAEPSPGWHDELADRLAKNYSTSHTRKMFANEFLVAPGGPLSDAVTTRRYAGWLSRFGVNWRELDNAEPLTAGFSRSASADPRHAAEEAVVPTGRRGRSSWAPFRPRTPRPYPRSSPDSGESDGPLDDRSAGPVAIPGTGRLDDRRRREEAAQASSDGGGESMGGPPDAHWNSVVLGWLAEDIRETETISEDVRAALPTTAEFARNIQNLVGRLRGVRLSAFTAAELLDFSPSREATKSAVLTMFRHNDMLADRVPAGEWFSRLVESVVETDTVRGVVDAAVDELPRIGEAGRLDGFAIAVFSAHAERTFGVPAAVTDRIIEWADAGRPAETGSADRSSRKVGWSWRGRRTDRATTRSENAESGETDRGRDGDDDRERGSASRRTRRGRRGDREGDQDARRPPARRSRPRRRAEGEADDRDAEGSHRGSWLEENTMLIMYLAVFVFIGLVVVLVLDLVRPWVFGG